MKIEQLMTRPVHTCQSQDTLNRAAQIERKANSGRKRRSGRRRLAFLTAVGKSLELSVVYEFPRSADVHVGGAPSRLSRASTSSSTRTGFVMYR